MSEEVTDENLRDFEELTRKANVKYTSAALTASAIGYFDLSDEPSLLASAFEAVCERDVEIAAFVVTTVLGLNLFLRVYDERRKLSQINEKINRLKVDLSSSIDKLLERLTLQSNAVQRILDEDEGLKKLALKARKLSETENGIRAMYEENFDPAIDNYEIEHGASSKGYFQKLNSLRKDFYEVLKVREDPTVIAQETFDKIDVIKNEIQKLNVSLTQKKTRVGPAKLRLWIFFVLIPAALYIFTIYALFYGER